MSVEAFTSVAPQDGEPIFTNAFPVMGHHWDVAYGDLVNKIAQSSSVSLLELYQEQTQRIMDDAWKSREWDLDFRRICGFNSDDDSLPHNKYADVVGRDEVLFRRKMDQHFMDFATSPDTRPVVIGPLLDHICRNCAFGDGNGGLHCQAVVVPGLRDHERIVDGEVRKTHEFLKEVDIFFGNPPKSELTSRYPEGVHVIVKNGTRSKKAYLVGNKEREGIVEVHTTLGLFRDVLTERANRTLGTTFDSFNAMLQAKGFSAVRPLSQ